VIYLIAKPDFVLAKCANRYGDIWKINQENNNQHPAPFPLNLLPVALYLFQNKLVLFLTRLFIGSGTKAIAAIEQGRDWLRMEQSVDYAQMARTY